MTQDLIRAFTMENQIVIQMLENSIRITTQKREKCMKTLYEYVPTIKETVPSATRDAENIQKSETARTAHHYQTETGVAPDNNHTLHLWSDTSTH